MEQEGCLDKISSFITEGLKNVFGRLGLTIGHHPIRFMAACVICSLLTALGLLLLYEETRREKLWLPSDTQILKNKEWLDENVPASDYGERIIATAGNILEAQKIQALFDIYQESLTIETSCGLKLSDVCVKAGSFCKVYGILEVWSFDDTTIQSLTDAQVLLDIKATTHSPVYGADIDFTNVLGGITYDSNGDITEAKAAIMYWFTQMGNKKHKTESWENKFIDLGNKGHSDLSNVHVFAHRSWTDETQKAIQSDILSLTIGYTLIILFMIFVLGKFNFKEQKAWLTLGGLVCIALSILVSIGLSSAFQQFYGPLQRILPFLLLGIGIDDAFVIMGALSNLTPEEQNYDIPEKVSAVLRDVGVSICVTSFTDFVAFMVGATTIIPALRTFCISAGLGIISLFLLQAMFFTACLTIDLRRDAQQRDACCFMIKRSENYEPNKCSQTEIIPLFFKTVLSSITTKLFYKITVLIIAATLVGVNLYGFVKLKTYFDVHLFFATDSYGYEFIQAEKQYFPSTGDPGHVYCKQLDYFTHKTELESLDNLMNQNPYIVNGTTDSWFAAFTYWLRYTEDADVLAMIDAVTKYPTSESNFFNLTYKLATEENTRTRSYLHFASDATIKASRFPFTNVVTRTIDQEIVAMDSVYKMITDAGFSSSECFPYAEIYLTWETNKIIKEELFRNIGLAMACVFLVSLLLISNIITSLLVCLCVVGTLINVCGSMYFWDLTIDTVSSVILIISVGLAVDYSAHVGHMFMTVRGSRNDRVKKTLGHIGPAVFYGGFSTFLAFLALADSNSFIFKTFFKINSLTVSYGLFHGLVFLPVMLSLVGPKPYSTAAHDQVLVHNIVNPEPID